MTRGFGAKMREKKWNYLCAIYKDPEAAFGTESATMGGRFGSEADGRKPWRDHVFVAKMRVKNGTRCGSLWCRKERKVFLIGIQRGRLAAKVRAGEARFGSELDGEKL